MELVRHASPSLLLPRIPSVCRIAQRIAPGSHELLDSESCHLHSQNLLRLQRSRKLTMSRPTACWSSGRSQTTMAAPSWATGWSVGRSTVPTGFGSTGRGLPKGTLQTRLRVGSYDFILNVLSRNLVSSTELTVEGLVEGLTYIFRVAAENQAGPGKFSVPSDPKTAQAPIRMYIFQLGTRSSRSISLHFLSLFYSTSRTTSPSSGGNHRPLD